VAPPSTAVRLASLVPADVAREVCQQVLSHLTTLAFGLAPAYALIEGHLPGRPGVPAPGLESSTLYGQVEALVTYAQTGADSEAEDAAVAADYAQDRLQAVCSALYSRAGEPGVFGVGELGQAIRGRGLDSPLAVVLVAAWARVELLADRPLGTGPLAALAGLSTDQVGVLVKRGEIRAGKRAAGKYLRIPAVECRRWLGARGVRGL